MVEKRRTCRAQWRKRRDKMRVRGEQRGGKKVLCESLLVVGGVGEHILGTGCR